MKKIDSFNSENFLNLYISSPSSVKEKGNFFKSSKEIEAMKHLDLANEKKKRSSLTTSIYDYGKNNYAKSSSNIHTGTSRLFEENIQKKPSTHGIYNKTKSINSNKPDKRKSSILALKALSFVEKNNFSTKFLPNAKLNIPGLRINDPKLRRNTLFINNEINKNIKDNSRNINDPQNFYSHIFDKWKLDDQNRKLDTLLNTIQRKFVKDKKHRSIVD